MKNILFLLILLSLFACENTKKVEAKPIPSESARRHKDDSASVVFHTFIFESRDSLPNIEKNVNNFDTVFRLRMRSGWGQFDDLCTIYNNNGIYKSQLIRSAPRGAFSNIRKKNSPNFEITEQNLSCQTWNQLNDWLNEHDVWNQYLPERSGIVIDGNNNYLFLKGKNNRYFAWDAYDFNFNLKTSSKLGQNLEGFAQKMLRVSAYPKLDYEIEYSIKKDIVQLRPNFEEDFRVPFQLKNIFFVNGKDTIELKYSETYSIPKVNFEKVKDSLQVLSVYYDNEREIVKPIRFKKVKNFE